MQDWRKRKGRIAGEEQKHLASFQVGQAVVLNCALSAPQEVGAFVYTQESVCFSCHDYLRRTNEAPCTRSRSFFSSVQIQVLHFSVTC